MRSDSIKIPDRLASRPRHRALPIPYVFAIASDGTTDFATLDASKWEACARLRLCGLCGQRLGGHLYFIGGPISASHGHYTDPPMHEECARYALAVCPFLAMGKGYRKAGGMQGATEIPGVSSEVPEKFGLLHCRNFMLVCNGGSYVFRALNVQGVEWFTHGKGGRE